jgi:hypothetical protein
MGLISVDWRTAAVRERELSVAFEEPISAPERKHVKALVDRLERPGEPWGTITVKKDRLIVSKIAPGAEDDLRHFLESLLLEANAAADEGSNDEHEQLDEHDRRMTDAFRAFAPEPSDT